MTDKTVQGGGVSRRALVGAGAAAGTIAGAAASLLLPGTAHAQLVDTTKSKLQQVLSRGKLIVGTGSTNAPWHFEDEKGELVGMDIAMARILGQGPVRRRDQGRVRARRTRPPASPTSPPARSTSSSSS